MIIKTILSLILVVLVPFTGFVSAGNLKQETGLMINKPSAFQGYTLFSPGSSNTTYLIDMEGEVAHKWESDAPPGNSVYLLENGILLRTESYKSRGAKDFPKGGSGGKVKMINWDGETIWEYTHSSSEYLSHHDVEYMPNGNILMIAWERISKDEMIVAGRNPRFIRGNHMFADKIIEVKPDLKNGGGEIIWEWDMIDHVIQDFDNTKENYGRVFRHHGLLDINFLASDLITDERNNDWTHLNAIDYHSELDQIAVSSPHMAEIYIINHNTTTEQAKGSAGDFLYRWGNPMAYRAGNENTRTLYFQHDIQWIGSGLPGEGNLLVYNNGSRDETRKYSTIDEFIPVFSDGKYQKETFRFLPENSTWNYTATPKEDLYSGHISGTQRLPNGNTLICSGADGIFTEVTTDGEIVWKYINPFSKKVGKNKKPSNDVFRCYRYGLDYPGLGFNK